MIAYEASVRRAAERFRRALEQQRVHLRSETLKVFPRGACGDASLLLGQYLHDIGLGDWTYQHGWRENGSHAWIERDGLIIDITADQFHGVSEAVLVTRERAWHDQFRNAGSRRPANLEFEGPSNRVLREDYALLASQANRSSTGG